MTSSPYRRMLVVCAALMTTASHADEFTISDADFINGVYEFRYYSKTLQASVNGAPISPASLFLTNDGWRAPSTLGAFWYAQSNDGFSARTEGSLTMGWNLDQVSRSVARVELLVDAHFAQFSPWTEHAWGDRLYGEIATPDGAFGSAPYTHLFEFIGDNNPATSSFGNNGELADLTALLTSGWLQNPGRFELKLGYEQHPVDAAHPSIPAQHLQVFRDGTGTGNDSFLLRITLAESRSNLVNISTRGMIGTGPQKLIAGFVIAGLDPKSVLIRGVGPTLGSFGVAGVIGDPRIDLYRKEAGGDVLHASNSDWAESVEMTETFVRVGAFSLQSGSKDACLMLTLDPGAYTAQVSGEENGTGVGLVEVYEVP